MAMRLSGLVSGMDTEAVIAQLMKVQSLKTQKIKNNITTTEWKQEKWSALNAKIYALYTGALSKIPLQSSYNIKTAASSNTAKIEVKAGANAPEGTHQIKIKQLASSQFVTGSKLGTDINGKAITAGTKLADLGFDVTEGTAIHIKYGDKQVDLEVRGSTTVGDFLSALQSAGLNANYDTSQKRFFISSKASGKENAFEITASSSEQVQARNLIRDFLGYDSLSSADKSKVNGYLDSYINSTLTTEDREALRNSLLDMKHKQVRAKFIEDYISDEDNISVVTAEVRAELEAQLEEGETLDEEAVKAAVKERLKTDAEAAVSALYDEWKNGEAGEDNVFLLAGQELDALLANYAGANSEPVSQAGSLVSLGLGEIVRDEEGNAVLNGNPNAVLVQASDAIVIYNGAELTSSSNNFSVNGLTFTLKGITAGLDTAGTEDDEVITLTISNNTQAVYDMIKDFINSYNEILKEMNDAYYAESARGYDPLTDEEKEKMTEAQIEKWENKIKDALLRRDDTLGKLIDIMRSTLSGSVNVNGKTMSLSSIGITTQGYSEKGILHILGDEDDKSVSASENKLMAALTNNPEEVMEIITTLTGKLHSALMDRMKSTSLSSAMTVYNDKELSKTLKTYKDDLTKMEKKLAEVEEKYYRQFAAMESALAQINSQNSALMSMLGINAGQF